MLFIFIAWLLTLVAFTIFLRALHTIPIYTHSQLELDGQKLQVRTVLHMMMILLSLALLLLMLHFTVADPAENFENHNDTHTAWINLSWHAREVTPR